MLNFNEFRKLNELPVSQDVEPQSATSTQQEPDVPPPNDADVNLLIGGLQGAGLGLIVSLLGYKVLQKVKKRLELSGYGRGYKAFIRFAKNVIGIDPYAEHKFTPEEAKQILGRLQKVVAQDKVNLAANDASGEQTTDNNRMLNGRINEFAGRLFNLTKTPKRAVSALGRAVAAFSRNTEPEKSDVQTVVGALSGGAASDDFKNYYAKKVGKPNPITSLGKGKNKVNLEPNDVGGPSVVNYEQGKGLPMTKITFPVVIGFYHAIYGPTIGQAKDSSPPKATGPIPDASANEKDAFAHNMKRTATALRSLRRSSSLNT